MPDAHSLPTVSATLPGHDPDGDVQALREPVKWERAYLPFDCPVCARRRLFYGVTESGNVIYVECEKCGANSDDETLNVRKPPRHG